MKLDCTYWPSVKAPIGKPFTTTWARLCERFQKPLEVAEKMAIPGWAPAKFSGNRRALDSVESVSAITYDIDELDCWFDSLCGCFRNAAFVHSTYSSMSDTPRARVILLLSRSLLPREQPRVWRALAGVMAEQGTKVDPAAKDASRLFFVPAVPPGKTRLYFARRIDGPPVDVEAVLANTPEEPAQLPAPPPSMVGTGTASASVIERARAYLAACPVAIAGQGGHNTAFTVAQRLTRGFGLDTTTAFELLLSSGWNAACQPPWSIKDLARKVNESASRGHMAIGTLRDAQRRRAG